MTELYHKIDEETQEKIEDLKENYQQAAIGTIGPDGFPVVTKVLPMKWLEDYYFLWSDLSQHTKNVGHNANVCLYVCGDEEHKSRMNNPRLSVYGTIERVDIAKDSPQFIRLVEKHKKLDPASKMYAYFGDFNFYKLTERDSVYVEGFGKAFKK